MTNEQYSNMMVAFAKLEAKIENIEKLLQPQDAANNVVIKGNMDLNVFSEQISSAAKDYYARPTDVIYPTEVRDACN